MPYLFKVLIIVIVFVLIKHAHAASFDCTKASTKNENTICSEPVLSSMDEQYASMYSYLVKKTQNNRAAQKEIKAAAIAALRMREKKCTDVRCLRQWYQAGRERMSQQLWQLDPVQLRKKITPESLYRKLNLLTFNNMDHQVLRAYNKRTLADLYPFSSVEFKQNQLYIEHDSKIWRIRIDSDDAITIDNKITNATYSSTSSETLYYDPIALEFRVGLPSHCNLYSSGSRPDNYRQNYLDKVSHGEIRLQSEVPLDSFTIYSSPNGVQSGTLNLQIERGTRQQTQETFYSTNIRICNKHFETYVEPAYHVRFKDEPSLLYFDQQGQWINLSSEPDLPAWIALADLPAALKKQVLTRESVVMQATSINIRSPHRMRAEPNTGSEILRVLDASDANEKAAIVPIEIKGDWIKVEHVTPNPLFVVNEANPNNFKKTLGWIKWREKQGVEYVDFDYAMSL